MYAEKHDVFLLLPVCVHDGPVVWQIETHTNIVLMAAAEGHHLTLQLATTPCFRVHRSPRIKLYRLSITFQAARVYSLAVVDLGHNR